MSRSFIKSLGSPVLLFAAGIILLGLIGLTYVLVHLGRVPAPVEVPSGLPVFSNADLTRYNGDDATLPIYVGLDGYVYDVTPGKEFYAPGGAYHSIAGTDASSELHIFGGDIIREKYEIVGVVAP